MEVVHSSWNSLPDGVATEVFTRLHGAEAKEGAKESEGEAERASSWGTLELVLGRGSGGPPGPFRLVCTDWARQVASSTEELQPCGREQPPGWGKRFAHLRRLDMSGCIGLRLNGEELSQLQLLHEFRIPSSATDEDILPLRCLTRLTSLDMGLCRRVTDTAMSALLPLTNLRALDLQGCNLLTDAAMATLAKLPALHSLCLTACRGITSASLSLLSPSRLDRLVLDDNRAMDDSALHTVAQRQASLSVLSIQYCSAISDAGLLALCTHLTGLTRLWLTGCPELTTHGVSALHGVTALEELSLAWCPLLTNQATEALAHLSCLTSLSLAGCANFSDATLQPLATLTSLRCLSLEDCVLLTDAASPQLARLPALSVLDLNGCSLLTERSLRELLPALKQLRNLDMRGTRVDPLAAEAMQARHPHLRVRVRALEL